MLRARLATAIVAIPLLVWVIFWAPGWLFSSVVLAFTVLSLGELAAMQKVPMSGAMVLTVASGLIVAISMLMDRSGATVSAGIVVALIGILLSTLASAEDMQKSVVGAGQIVFACLYGGLLLPHLVWLRALDRGPELVFFVLASVMASDAGGYFGGRALGRRKLWPSVSPNKTVEGALSSIGAAVVVGSLFEHFLIGRFALVEALLVTATVSVLGQLGDLAESMIKRAYDAKDSGRMLPGHGGVLDRTDSMVLPIVFTYYYASIAWT